MSIHILTSYKGGVGKTSISLSIANHCVQHGKNFTLIDTNPQNSNLAEDIFFYFHVDSVSKTGIEIAKNSTIYTLSPGSDTTFTVIDATNQNPFEVAKYLQQNCNDKEHVYIIDTNVHIRSAPNKIFKREGIHKVYIWFLWGWSSPRLDHQLQSIIDAIDNIEGCWPGAQVIHVFNLYDFYTGGLQSFSLRKASTTLRPLKNVVKHLDKMIDKFMKNKCKAIYIDGKIIKDVMGGLHTTLVRYVAPDNLTMQELPILWSSHLMEIVKISDKKYPYNILLIPTFFKELTMSTDRIVMAAPRSFEKIISLITPMAEYISVFLTSLNQCLAEEKLSDIKNGTCDV